ncbi:MAG TPA: RNase adapter RapZ [Salinivirga sp.]|uniref:RapZ C-terminal domain-containing protein n=1 Tax=Salinivirga sp. TaxID=1970192 RepID=UPI002B48CB45|nr:RNase adapter RapZ [Salinivirga sp.]HKK59254.1 RNase adapter RapZ [Salinivirga sp.]
MDVAKLEKLFQNISGEAPEVSKLFKKSGSGRQYYRLKSEKLSLIGCMNSDVDENEAFFHLSGVFSKAGLNVPEVLAIDESRQYYIQTDLGDQMLYNIVTSRQTENLDDYLLNQYKKVLSALIDFQTIDQSLIDSSKYYPLPVFNRQSIEWDLNYFKYYFLKLHDITFNERKLQTDFDAFIGQLLNDEMHYFMFRDFQSRNILLKNDEPWFIDFQGGRKGPLAYDVASLLYQAKANLTPDDRDNLLRHYLSELESKTDIDAARFMDYFYPNALLRTLQVLGAYGYRGLFQRKTHFLTSIGKALRNLKSILPSLSALNHVPELSRCLHELVERIPEYENKPTEKFKVVIQSFSYLDGGVPPDTSGHGGGYVFDCRMLPNPGRDPYYANMNGMDKEVKDYLEKHQEVETFIANALEFGTKHIETYLNKDFNYLSISFGCTGGQHRSVYCAEQTASQLKKKFPDIVIQVNHLIQKVAYQC